MLVLQRDLMEAGCTCAAMGPLPAPSLGTALSSSSASSCQSLELCLWAFVLSLNFFFALLARCVLRYQKSLREVIFWVWKRSELFLYTFMVFVSSLYAISVYKRFQRHSLFSDSRGKPPPPIKYVSSYSILLPSFTIHGDSYLSRNNFFFLKVDIYTYLKSTYRAPLLCQVLIRHWGRKVLSLPWISLLAGLAIFCLLLWM